jgi:hypothetical protein
MHRITLSAQALAAAMNAELYRRGVPAFVRVDAVVRAPAGEGAGGADWTFSLERSPVPLHDDATAARYAQALFAHERQVEDVAEWAAARFSVAWDCAPRLAVFIPSPEPAVYPPKRTEPVAAQKGAAGGG